MIFIIYLFIPIFKNFHVAIYFGIVDILLRQKKYEELLAN